LRGWGRHHWGVPHHSSRGSATRIASWRQPN
jgi:hypothetical protein